MANLTLVQAINLALTQEMEADPRIMIGKHSKTISLSSRAPRSR